MDYLLEFELPGLPKTVNNIGRLHWSIKAKEARLWVNSVCLIARPKRPKEPLKCARLTLTRLSSRCPDYDGLVMSFKHVVDGLIKAGIIENDTMKNIGIPDFKWVQVKTGQGSIHIRVEEGEPWLGMKR